MWFYNKKRDGNWEILNEDNELISVLPYTEDTFSKSILWNSLELFELCQKIQTSSVDDFDNLKKEANNLINLINDTSINAISNYDNIVPVAYINESDDCLNYSLNSKIEDLILFEEFYNGLGFIRLNIGGPEHYFTKGNTANDIRIIKKNLLSKEVFEGIVTILKRKYIYSSEFFQEYDNHSDVGIIKHLSLTIDELCAEEYTKTMSLYDYLEKYPLITGNNGIIKSTNSSPSFKDCDFSIHSLFKIYINNNCFEGMIYYRKDDDKYYIYNVFKDQLILSPILNKEDVLKNTKIEFIDYIDS